MRNLKFLSLQIPTIGNSKNISGKDNSLFVLYKYERLQYLCFNCGIMGHEQKSCKIPKVMATFCSSTPKYDHHLSVPTPKPITVLLKKHKKRNDSRGVTKCSRETESQPSSKNSEEKQRDKETVQHKSYLAADKAKENSRNKVISDWEEVVANCSDKSLLLALMSSN